MLSGNSSHFHRIKLAYYQINEIVQNFEIEVTCVELRFYFSRLDAQRLESKYFVFSPFARRPTVCALSSIAKKLCSTVPLFALSMVRFVIAVRKGQLLSSALQYVSPYKWKELRDIIIRKGRHLARMVKKSILSGLMYSMDMYSMDKGE